MKIAFYILFFVSINIYAQEKVYYKQAGNKIGFKTDDSTKAYSPVVVFKDKELSLTNFEHAFFSPNHELVAVVTHDSELYYRNKKTFDELEDRIVIYDVNGVPIRTIFSKPVLNIAINNKGELILCKIIGPSGMTQFFCNIETYNERGEIIESNTITFIGQPMLNFLNDSILVVYGDCTFDTNKIYNGASFAPYQCLLIYNNLVETGEKFFPMEIKKGILPSIALSGLQKPILTDSLIRIYARDCVFDNEVVLYRNPLKCKCDSITLFFNLKGEIVRKVEHW